MSVVGNPITLGGGGGGGHTPEVPSGYTQLLALRSSGTQCINTRFIADINTKLEADCQSHFGSPGWYMCIFGSYQPSVSFLSTNTIDVNASGTYNTFGNSVDKSGGSSTLLARKIVTIDKANVTITINDQTRTIALNATSMDQGSNPVCVFGRKEGNVYARFSIADVYRAKIWDNGTLVRHFVPCMRDSDSVLGMYDLCESICPDTNSPFYVNNGTGSFVGVDYD